MTALRDGRVPREQEARVQVQVLTELRLVRDLLAADREMNILDVDVLQGAQLPLHALDGVREVDLRVELQRQVVERHVLLHLAAVRQMKEPPPTSWSLPC